MSNVDKPVHTRTGEPKLIRSFFFSFLYVKGRVEAVEDKEMVLWMTGIWRTIRVKEWVGELGEVVDRKL